MALADGSLVSVHNFYCLGAPRKASLYIHLYFKSALSNVMFRDVWWKIHLFLTSNARKKPMETLAAQAILLSSWHF